MDDILNIIKPMHICAKILGVSPFSIKEKQLIVTKQNFFYSLTVTILFSYIVFTYFQQMEKYMSSKKTLAKTVYFVMIFRNITNVLKMGAICIIVFVKSKKFRKNFTDIAKLDADLERLDLKIFLKKFNVKLRKNMLFLYLITQICVNFLCSGLLFFTELSSNYYSFFIISAVKVYPRLVVNTMNLVFYSCIMMISGHFQALNYLICQNIQINKFTPDKRLKFCDNLQFLTDFHNKLVSLARDVNSMYALYLLLYVSSTFVLFVADLYLFAHFIYFRNKNLYEILFMIANILTYVMDLNILVKFSESLCFEANRTHRLVVALELDVDDEKSRNIVRIY